MKSLEEIYTENVLVRPSFPQRKTQEITTKQKIEKIQGLFSSLLLELDQLKESIDGRDDDNGFVNTLDIISNNIDTPFAIFDQTFYLKKNDF